MSNLINAPTVVFDSKTKKNLEEHLKNHTGENSYQCSKCIKTFATKRKLDYHMKYHMVSKCSLCPAEFTALSDLWQHKKNKHDGKSIQCEKCLSTFINTQQLRQLKLSQHGHDTEKLFQCQLCPSVVNNQAHLSEQMETHTVDKPWINVIPALIKVKENKTWNPIKLFIVRRNPSNATCAHPASSVRRI